MLNLPSELATALVNDYRQRPRGRGPAELPPGVDRLTGGRNNGVYRVSSDGDAVCVKVYRSDERPRGDHEWRALQFLRSHGCPFTPSPYQHLTIDRTAVVVMELLPGRHLGKAALSQEQQVALAERIRWLHQLPHSPESLPEGATAKQRIARLEAHLQTATPISPETSLGLQLIESWLSSPDVATSQQEDKLVFSRLDTSLANALWDGTTIRFVDLEYAGWLPSCLDLAEQVEHVQSRGTPDGVWQEILRSVDPELPRVLWIATQRLLVLEWLERFWPADDDLSPDFLDYLRRAETLCGREL